MYFELKAIQRIVLILLVSLVVGYIIYEPAHEKPRVILPPMYVTSPTLKGCDPTLDVPQRIRIPSFKDAWQTVEICEQHHSDETAWAMTIFYDEWIITFGDDDGYVLNALGDIEITWSMESKIEKNLYGLDGTFYEEAEVHGLFQNSPEHIWVYAPIDTVISDTALIHELIHLALFVSFGDPDPDHEGDKYSGWTVNHTQLIDKVAARLHEYHDL